MPLYVVTATRLVRQFTQAVVEIEADSPEIACSTVEEMESDGDLTFTPVGPADDSNVKFDAVVNLMTHFNPARLESMTAVKNLIRSPYAWPGGYPMYLLTDDAAALCASCVKKEYRLICESTVKGHRDGWAACGSEINWEDTDLICDHCGERIESTYGKSEEES